MGKYIELTNDNFEGTVNSGVSLVDFWAPWCGPCRMVAPIIDELAQDFDGRANICKVNGIRSIPTILIMKDGEIVDQVVGASSKQALSDKINHHI